MFVYLFFFVFVFFFFFLLHRLHSRICICIICIPPCIRAFCSFPASFIIIGIISVYLRPESREHKPLVPTKFRSFARLAVCQASREKSPALRVVELFHNFQVTVIAAEIFSCHTHHFFLLLQFFMLRFSSPAFAFKLLALVR